MKRLPQQMRVTPTQDYKTYRKPATAQPPPPAAAPKSAVIVAHGVGQQLEFSALDFAVQGLLRIGGFTTPVASTIRVAGEPVRRIELQKTGGGDVHLYEIYWAPYTEGEVGIADVVRFLFLAAMRGIPACFHDFQRWMFGGWQNFGKRRGTFWALLLALSVVCSLIFLNFALTTVYAWNVVRGDHESLWTLPLVQDVTVAVDLYLAAGLLLGLGYVVAAMVRARRRAKNGGVGTIGISAILSRILRWSFYLMMLLLSVLALAVAFLLLYHARSDHQLLSIGALPQTIGWPIVVIVTWLLFVLASARIRAFFVQYVGDVVAYVFSYTLDRFNDLRKKIKTCALDTTRAVYSLSATGGVWEYDRVAFVCHSLGSVISYDTLNRLLLDDEAGLAAGTTVLDVQKRTSALITFGSPLDKTAYLFRLQAGETSDAREALAATVQPLIRDSKFRTIPWINVFAPDGNDIIGSSLDFHDQGAAPGAQKVQNVPDPDAMTPLAAHNEHWRNNTLWTWLAKYV